MLNELENMLRNLENDRMLMSYGDNQAVVNSILSVVNMVQGLSSLMRSDRVNDMFALNVSNKIMELENIVSMYGSQRLMERGLGRGMGGMQQPMYNPMGSQPMYNQQMYAPNMMYNPMAQQPMQQPMPQMMPQQPMPQMQQQMAQPAAAPAPVAPAPPVMNAAPEPPKPVANADGEAKPAAAASFSLPGMGGDEKAAGRDYLLALLGEK